MGRKLFFEFLLLAGLCVLVWAIFTYYPLFDKDTSLEISIEQEEKLGDLMVDNLLDKENQVDHPRVDSAVFLIHRRLRNGLKTTEFDYDIYVIRSEMINAATLPGGNVIIYSELIEFTESPEELAGVMAHEMGHVEHRHVTKRLVRKIGVSLLFTALGGNDPMLIGEILQTVSSTAFDRREEREADQFAMDLLTQTDISPRVIARFFRRLNDEYGAYNETLELVSTHPHTNARIKAAMEYETPDTFKHREFSIQWDSVQAALDPVQHAVTEMTNN
jgi:predicted Zn-dependent protease